MRAFAALQVPLDTASLSSVTAVNTETKQFTAIAVRPKSVSCRVQSMAAQLDAKDAKPPYAFKRVDAYDGGIGAFATRDLKRERSSCTSHHRHGHDGNIRTTSRRTR